MAEARGRGLSHAYLEINRKIKVLASRDFREMPGPGRGISLPTWGKMEAESGIEPLYEDLQSSA